MSKYRDNLPLLSDETFITDGGLETTLIFQDGYDLPEFAAFDLFKSDQGYQSLRDYFSQYADLACANKVGYVLESPTWRASRDWGTKLGYRVKDLKDINRASIAMLQRIRAEKETSATKMVISGCIGPRGDGYSVNGKMSVEEATRYHLEQIMTFSATEADLVSAYTINYVEEAIGIAKAAQSVGIPSAIGFTVETDGRLPSGQPLGEAIDEVDRKTGNTPAYYMINCAHPIHFAETLVTDESWTTRIRAIRANASTLSHAELDEAEELDAGDPVDLGRRYARLKAQFSHFNIFGGCCGTDHRHIEQICKAVTSSN